MTAAEFNLWLDDLEIRFPSVTKWLGTAAPDEANRLRLLQSWQAVLADVGHKFALQVNAQMQAGDAPWLGQYEPIERLPQHIRHHARQLAWEANQIANTEHQYANLREPRYRCHLCLDREVIEIASPTAIRCILSGGDFAKCWHKIGVVRCRCNNREFPPLQFDQQLDFKVEDFSWRVPEVERLRAWVAFQREHGAEQRAKSHANYNKDFEAFNNR